MREYSKTYLNAIEGLLRREGGYVNHPDDPGGATNYGITQRAWDAYSLERGHQTCSVKALQRPDAIAFYWDEYWTRLGLGTVPVGLAIHIMDMSINAGVRVGVRLAQRAHNILRPADSAALMEDGILGPVSRVALSRLWSRYPEGFAACYAGERYCFYARLVGSSERYRSFIRGWANRLAEVSVDASAIR